MSKPISIPIPPRNNSDHRETSLSPAAQSPESLTTSVTKNLTFDTTSATDSEAEYEDEDARLAAPITDTKNPKVGIVEVYMSGALPVPTAEEKGEGEWKCKDLEPGSSDEDEDDEGEDEDEGYDDDEGFDDGVRYGAATGRGWL